ncbi:hypothetical protein GW17_00034632 [Ensete ventricosum]|nr:hypothetical protein GW17_00034632 [Ensete ventricosum]
MHKGLVGMRIFDMIPSTFRSVSLPSRGSQYVFFRAKARKSPLASLGGDFILTGRRVDRTLGLTSVDTPSEVVVYGELVGTKLARDRLDTELKLGQIDRSPMSYPGGRLLEWWSSDRVEAPQLGSDVRSVDLTCVRSAVRPLMPPYLHPTDCPRWVGHVGGPVVRGHEDVATRSTSVISFFLPREDLLEVPD